MAVEAVVDHQELVVVVPVVLRLGPNVLQRHPPGSDPRLQHRPHLRRHAAGVVEDEVRAGSEEPSVVGHPLSHPRGAQVAVQRRAAVEILVFVRRSVLGLVVRARSLLQGGELLVPTRGLAVVGVDNQLAAAVVGIGILGERAIDDDDGVDAAVAPIWEHLVGLGLD